MDRSAPCSSKWVLGDLENGRFLSATTSVAVVNVLIGQKGRLVLQPGARDRDTFDTFLTDALVPSLHFGDSHHGRPRSTVQ